MLDDNDCIPEFPQPLYTWNISEGSLPGQAFIDVAASDCDLGTNAEIEYRVIGGKHRTICLTVTINISCVHLCRSCI